MATLSTTFNNTPIIEAYESFMSHAHKDVKDIYLLESVSVWVMQFLVSITMIEIKKKLLENNQISRNLTQNAVAMYELMVLKTQRAREIRQMLDIALIADDYHQKIWKSKLNSIGPLFIKSQYLPSDIKWERPFDVEDPAQLKFVVSFTIPNAKAQNHHRRLPVEIWLVIFKLAIGEPDSTFDTSALDALSTDDRSYTTLSPNMDNSHLPESESRVQPYESRLELTWSILRTCKMFFEIGMSLHYAWVVLRSRDLTLSFANALGRQSDAIERCRVGEPTMPFNHLASYIKRLHMNTILPSDSNDFGCMQITDFLTYKETFRTLTGVRILSLRWNPSVLSIIPLVQGIIECCPISHLEIEVDHFADYLEDTDRDHYATFDLSL